MAKTLTARTKAEITLAEASELIPGNPHVATLNRWATLGVKGVVLPTLLVGGRRYTSRTSISWFLQQLNPGVDQEAIGNV